MSNTPPPKKLIYLNDIGKVFQTDAKKYIIALTNINLSILENEFITIIGSTGCGKTTLLKIIAGIESSSSGCLKYHDELNVSKDIASVFQHYTLFPWLNILDNVAFGPKMQGVAKKVRREQAFNLLREVKLEKFTSAYPHELSGGMRQRVAIAQALATKPKLLLMDEPFGALDDKTRSLLQDMLINIWQQHNITILFVTHNIDEAVKLGSKTIIFNSLQGTICKQLNIDLARPRDTLNKEFTSLVMKIRHTILTND